jgi:mannose-6-phosphate isomerase-like protein (cupin superfamily)
MGSVVTFAQLPGSAAGEGIRIAPLTRGDTKDMAAELVRIAPGKRWDAKVPNGADCYLFALNGSAAISSDEKAGRLAAQTFATVQEGHAFSVHNEGDTPIEIVKVIAPPKPNKLTGFVGGLEVAARASTPVLDVPAERKKRIIFVGHHAVESERAHAMIVVYDGQTNTALHHHPNAESMFVMLDGAVEFTVNGKQEVLKAGQAVYFQANDVHALHTADGFPGASFLEFHIPAAYSTVKLAKS